MKRLLAMLAFVAMGLASAAAFALPTVSEVQAEVQKGNYTQAESMMRDVVAAKPGSAKAHYIYAEILAHNKRYEYALQEARLAQQIDPALGFTQPDKFKSFEQLLEREQRHANATAGGGSAGTTAAVPAPRAAESRSAGGGGIPGWVWGLGFAVIAVLLWRMFSARRNVQAMAPAYGGVPTGGYGPNYSPMGGQPGGSGMLGTGLAAAGGFAAGMLAEKLIDGHRDGGSAGSSHLDGGTGAGYQDNSAADELSNRSIDFGSGGGDWDSGGGGGGGSDEW